MFIFLLSLRFQHYIVIGYNSLPLLDHLFHTFIIIIDIVYEFR